MKIIIFLLLVTSAAHALEIEFYGPCSSKPLLTGLTPAKGKSIGESTMAFLDQNKVPHQGTKHGLNQLYDSPVGDAALEVISDVEMKAYGWCYFIDDVAPEVLPSEFPATGVKNVKWIYGYAHYLKGEWIAQCRIAYLNPPAKFCR